MSDPGPVRNRLLAFAAGAPVGLLGGLIGLGGAEFRLPILKAGFRYQTGRAVALNLAVSLVTLLASLAARLRVSALADVAPALPVAVAMISGSIVGAYLGAAYATRISSKHLERLIFVLLIAIGLLLTVEAFVPFRSGVLSSNIGFRLPLAAAFGLGIGIVSSLLGVAGGELIIPTLILVFGFDIKPAGTASVLISVPTVVVGCWQYARKGAFADRQDLSSLVVPMGLGSIGGAMLGGMLLPYAPSSALKLVLGVILIGSAIKIFRHQRGTANIP